MTTNTLPGGAPTDGGSDLVFAVDDYTKDAARFHALRERSTQAVLRDGRARFAAWEGFHREMFARCLGNPERLDAPRSGAEWADKLHTLADDVTELRDLRAQTRGNEWWSNLAASAIERTLIEQTKAPAGGPVADGSEDAEVAEALRALLDEPGLPEAERAALADAADAAQERADKAAKAAKAAAQRLDPTDVREALRAGVAVAKNDIADAQRSADGFGFGQGSDPHAGGRAGHRAAQKLAEVVRSNDRLRRIAEFAGRLRRIADRQQSAKPRTGTDELCGIEQGDDLARLLPSELVYAADPTLEAVFGRRFAEGSLDLYELRRTPPKQQGPIVFCLDSSGSMKWNNHDAWAAAVALAFLHIAQAQGRAFALVHFGSTVLRVDRFAAKVQATSEQAMEAVGFFASCGGTEFEPALDGALGIIHDEGDLRDADIVFCTDGQASVDAGWLAAYNAERARLGIRVQGICIGPESSATTLQSISDEVVYLADALRDEGDMHGVFGRV